MNLSYLTNLGLIYPHRRPLAAVEVMCSCQEHVSSSKAVLCRLFMLNVLAEEDPRETLYVPAT